MLRAYVVWFYKGHIVCVVGGNGRLGLPGGKLHQSESAKTALEREIKEEVGVTFDSTLSTVHRKDTTTLFLSDVDDAFIRAIKPDRVEVFSIALLPVDEINNKGAVCMRDLDTWRERTVRLPEWMGDALGGVMKGQQIRVSVSLFGDLPKYTDAMIEMAMLVRPLHVFVDDSVPPNIVTKLRSIGALIYEGDRRFKGEHRSIWRYEPFEWPDSLTVNIVSDCDRDEDRVWAEKQVRSTWNPSSFFLALSHQLSRVDGGRIITRGMNFGGVMDAASRFVARHPVVDRIRGTIRGNEGYGVDEAFLNRLVDDTKHRLTKLCILDREMFQRQIRCISVS